jgi:hypothetical protein
LNKERDNIYSKTSLLEKPVKNQLQHDHENFLFLSVLLPLKVVAVLLSIRSTVVVKVESAVDVGSVVKASLELTSTSLQRGSNRAERAMLARLFTWALYYLSFAES